SGLAALVALAVYAASCRPDLALVTLPLLLATALAVHPPRVVGLAFARAWPFVLAAAALAGPLVLARLRNTRAHAAARHLPRLARFWRSLPANLLVDNTMLQPLAFPVAVWLLVVGALVVTRRRSATWLVAASLVAIAPTFVDYNETSNLRLQVPGATMLVL